MSTFLRSVLFLRLLRLSTHAAFSCSLSLFLSMNPLLEVGDRRRTDWRCRDNLPKRRKNCLPETEVGLKFKPCFSVGSSLEFGLIISLFFKQTSTEPFFYLEMSYFAPCYRNYNYLRRKSSHRNCRFLMALFSPHLFLVSRNILRLGRSVLSVRSFPSYLCRQ